MTLGDAPPAADAPVSASGSRSSLVGFGAIAVASAAGAALSGARPTALAPADILWSAALGGILVLVGVKSSPWTWIWLAGVAAVASVGSATALACSVLALALAVGGGTARRPHPLLGPLAMAFGTQALLRLPATEFFGMPSLLAALAIAPPVFSAYRNSTRSIRRTARWTLLAAGTLVLLAIGAFGSVAVSSRGQLEAAVARSRSGLDAVRKGDQADANEALAEASRSFRSAHDSLTAPWALPIRVIPVAGQQAEALSRLSDLGADLADTGAVSASKANYRELRAAKGTVDLAKLTGMQQPVTAAASALNETSRGIDELRSGWLVSPISSPLNSLGAEISAEAKEADLARDVLAVAPGLLGGKGPRRYAVLFTNPAESRFGGGFVGALAELDVDNGKVTLSTSTDESQFADTLEARERVITIPPDLAQRYSRYDPARYLQNLTVSPDFGVDAGLVREVYPQVTGRAIDGVIMADPYALAGFLTLTGPVKVEGIAQPLSAETAVEYLLKGQYLTKEGDTIRKERLGDSARATFDALTSRDLPGPRTMGDALGPALRDGHLQFMVFDPRENALLDRLGLIRRFDPTPGHDYVSMRTANANPNKIDTYLSRRLDYEATYAPTTGEVRARATVTLTNTAPQGLPPYVAGNNRQQPDGSNTTYLSLYSPLSLREATENLSPFPIESQSEFGGAVYSSLVTIPAGQTRTITFELQGALTPTAEYQLDVFSQPTINADGLRVVVHSSEDAARIGRADGLTTVGDAASLDSSVTESRKFTVSFVAR